MKMLIFLIKNNFTKYKNKLNEKKTTGLKMGNKGKLAFLAYVVFILSQTIGVTTVLANDPIGVVNNLSDFIFGLIRALGMIMVGFGIVQIGLSFKSHDPTQRANGFLTLAGGIVITFAREILNLIVG